jgi:hypothetical protein
MILRGFDVVRHNASIIGIVPVLFPLAPTGTGMGA